MKARKISASIVGGACVVIIVWLVDTISGVVIPPDVAGAGGALLTYGASILIPDEIEE